MDSKAKPPISGHEELEQVSGPDANANEGRDESTSAAEDARDPHTASEKLRKEKEELYDRLLRKQAEFENYRKRVDREKKEATRLVQASVIREFLPVVDACQRALKSLGDTEGGDSNPFRSGLELIYKQFADTLAKFDVHPIPSVGRTFDPNLHHAIMREETSDYPENQILEELLKGYTHENRLLRPAQVKVAIAPSVRKPKNDKDDASA